MLGISSVITLIGLEFPGNVEVHARLVVDNVDSLVVLAVSSCRSQSFLGRGNALVAARRMRSAEECGLGDRKSGKREQMDRQGGKEGRLQRALPISEAFKSDVDLWLFPK